jgi:hypothetical protein
LTTPCLAGSYPEVNNFYPALHQFFFFLALYHRSDFIISSSCFSSARILHSLGISLILALISFIVILFYSFNSIFFSFDTILNCLLLTRFFRMFHTLSNELRSEDWDEWFNVVIQLIVLHDTTTLSLDRVSWLLSLSSCKMQYLSSWMRISLIKFAYTDNKRSV